MKTARGEDMGGQGGRGEEEGERKRKRGGEKVQEKTE